MLTIGQLARAVGVSTKTIRVYHAKGLLPEPERDSSGYRRYSAQAVVELIKLRTLAEAGVPLAKIPTLSTSPVAEFQHALDQLDQEMTARIEQLRRTQQRLRELAAGEVRLLPDEVEHHLRQLPELGFTARWVAMERDLWIVVFTTYLDTAAANFRDQADTLTDPAIPRLLQAEVNASSPAWERLDSLIRRRLAVTFGPSGAGLSRRSAGLSS
ncbi:transcriptional regulator, MerR family [Kribbella flavida DSM 17836]|uniref:Transcriptional regulator, MerR family n=1 Tax=Kribbella flavida (strain DSM 17836 / JCM 10339 / NBRC 14399) TaxID=479435 RepID=D2PR86_KRIFD|nr:MerR family transcriptional regulator [Kribbella flavida]ADB33034.1 transcriptional regulator, MerR family [Kribbella flavida DSM 17836]